MIHFMVYHESLKGFCHSCVQCNSEATNKGSLAKHVKANHDGPSLNVRNVIDNLKNKGPL